MNALNLKSCVRCGGDLHARSDDFGRYLQCLQCGYHGYFDRILRKSPNDDRNIPIDRGHYKKRKGGDR